MTPVGVADIAQRCGVTPWAVGNWRRPQRHLDFPPPAGTVSEAPWWDWETVCDWLERTGRGWRVQREEAS